MWLLRLRHGKEEVIRDGDKLGDPVRKVGPLAFVLFHNLPKGMNPHGDASLEVIACKDEKHAKSLMSENKSKVGEANRAAVEYRKRVLAKMKAQSRLVEPVKVEKPAEKKALATPGGAAAIRSVEQG